MLTALSTVTPASGLPVSVQLARQHARVDGAYDTNLVQLYVQSAWALAEAYLDRSLLPQTLTYTMARTAPPNAWPMTSAPVIIMPLGMEWLMMVQRLNTLRLPRSPVTSVASVAYGAWGQSDTTMTQGTDYDLDLTTEPARVRLYTPINWANVDHLTVTYQAGYASAAAIPVPIQHALLMTAAHMFESRGDSGTPEAIPVAAQRLMDPFRLPCLPTV